MSGYVHLHRKSMQSDIWQQPALYWKVWCWILMEAAWKDHTLKNGTLIKRGSFPTSYGKMQKALTYRFGRGWKEPSLTNLKRALRYHKSAQLVDLKSDHLGMIITVVNYDLYNDPGKLPGPIVGPIENSKSAYIRIRGTEEVPPKVPKTPLETLVLQAEGPSPLDTILERFHAKIQPSSRMTKAAKSKIYTRLNEYSLEQLLTAIDNFSREAWWMEHHSTRPMAWFFHSEDRIEQFLLLSKKKQVDNPHGGYTTEEFIAKYGGDNGSGGVQRADEEAGQRVQSERMDDWG